MSTVVAIAEPPAGVGHNGAPLSPYEAVAVHLNGLLMEARNWADGVAVESQAQADEISRLIEDLRLGEQAADAARVREKAPLDEQIAEIQDRYNLYIAPLKNKKPGKVPVAVEALKAALKPFLDALESEKRAKAAEAAKIAQAALEAAQAAAKAAQTDNLESREAAGDLEEKARQAQKAAAYAQNDKAQARGGSRALGLKTFYRAEVTDMREAFKHYLATDPAAFGALVKELAQTDVQCGKRQIPGVTVHQETRL